MAPTYADRPTEILKVDHLESEFVQVSVVIPCLNECMAIASCVRQANVALKDAGIEGEVVVADNGSTDGSPDIAEQAGARVVRISRRGYGAAVRGGIDAALGEFIVLGDADGQHDFSQISAFVEKLWDGNDLVMGNRFGSPIPRGAMSWTHRRIGNPLLSGLVRLFFYRGIHDAQCGMRALRRSAYLEMDLRTTGFELCPEMVIKAAHHHMRITEIPIIVLPAARDRPPHLRTIVDGWRHLIFLLMCAPNWLFGLPGGVLLTIGIFTVSWLYSGPQHVGSIELNTRMELFGVLIGMLGFQLLSVGAFARVFSYSAPRNTRSRSVTRFLRSLKLEQGLAVGAFLMIIGLAGDLVNGIPWAYHGFGALHQARSVIFWSLWLFLGFQICLSSVFLSMIGISRGTWAGDPT